MRSSPGLSRLIRGRALSGNRRRGRAERHGLGGVGADARISDVDDDDADVVRCSGLVGQGDELAYGVGGIRRGRQDGADRLVAYDWAEAIGADQVAVSGSQVAVAEANAEVARRAAEDPARFGMGTTLTAMLWSGNKAALVHIGDSRAFRLRDGQLRRITEDHVLGNLVSNAGALAPALSRYLDGRSDRSPDLGLRELQAGDRYLICSDGLSPVVSTEAIGAALAAAPDPADAVRQLVAMAEEAGGPDNVSVIVIDVRDASVGSEPSIPVTLGAAGAAVTR